ncbi:MAG TPA: hypothetical protein VF479_08310 [Pseudolysinimonas sp.]
MSANDSSPAANDDGALSKVGILKFLTNGLGVPKDVALKIFPDLAKLVSRGADAIASFHRDASESNAQSNKAALKHEKFLAKVYAEQLRLEGLTPEERAALNERLEDGAQRVFAKDSENKEFILTLLKLATAGVISALAIAVVAMATKSDDGSAGI